MGILPLVIILLVEKALATRSPAVYRVTFINCVQVVKAEPRYNKNICERKVSKVAWFKEITKSGIPFLQNYWVMGLNPISNTSELPSCKCFQINERTVSNPVPNYVLI